MGKQRLLTFLQMCVVTGACCTQLYAESVAIGFPSFSTELNMVESKHPVARFARKVIAGSLTERRSASIGSYRLQLADNMMVNANLQRWSFRLTNIARHSSGHPVTGEDIKYSASRCSNAGQLPVLTNIEIERRWDTLGEGREWITFTLAPQAESDIRQAFPVTLADCSVFEAMSAKVFGSDFGRGSNFVASGPFRLKHILPGRELTFERRSSVTSRRVWASELVLRGFADSDHGLTALRLGAIAALFTRNERVLKQAQDDGTLEERRCFDMPVITRRSFQLACDPDLDLESIRFISGS